MLQEETPGRLGPGPWQTARVAAVAALTPRLKSFRLVPERPFAFRAGQHVDIRLTAPDGYQAQRSYSIASAPESAPELELGIERLDDGEVSPFFHDVVEVGDTIELRGPIGGHFVWEAAEGVPLLAIGGGSGAVPLVAMVRHRALSAAAVPAAILVSARTEADVPYRDELAALAACGDGLAARFALTREEARRPEDFGRRIDAAMVADMLARHPLMRPRVYVCGSNAFVEAAVAAVLAAGIEAGAVRTERYGE
jgi:ferredoxin-NADP reductase